MGFGIVLLPRLKFGGYKMIDVGCILIITRRKPTYESHLSSCNLWQYLFNLFFKITMNHIYHLVTPLFSTRGLRSYHEFHLSSIPGTTILNIIHQLPVLLGGASCLCWHPFGVVSIFVTTVPAVRWKDLSFP